MTVDRKSPEKMLVAELRGSVQRLHEAEDLAALLHRAMANHKRMAESEPEAPVVEHDSLDEERMEAFVRLMSCLCPEEVGRDYGVPF